jgi:hypothetical protein
MEAHMYSLLVANIPHDCEQEEIKGWIEARGVRIVDLKLISDLVSKTSPSFAQVELPKTLKTDEVARLLDGQQLRGRVLKVKELKLIDTTKHMRLKASA